MREGDFTSFVPTVYQFKFLRTKIFQVKSTVISSPNTVFEATSFIEPKLFLWPENLKRTMSIQTIKVAPKQSRLPKVYFEAPIEVAFLLQNTRAQIVVF